MSHWDIPGPDTICLAFESHGVIIFLLPAPVVEGDRTQLGVRAHILHAESPRMNSLLSPDRAGKASCLSHWRTMLLVGEDNELDGAMD